MSDSTRPTSRRLRITLDTVFEFNRELEALPFTDENAQIADLYRRFDAAVRAVFGADAMRVGGRGHYQFTLDRRPLKGHRNKKAPTAPKKG